MSYLSIIIFLGGGHWGRRAFLFPLLLLFSILCSWILFSGCLYGYACVEMGKNPSDPQRQGHHYCSTSQPPPQAMKSTAHTLARRRACFRVLCEECCLLNNHVLNYVFLYPVNIDQICLPDSVGVVGNTQTE